MIDVTILGGGASGRSIAQTLLQSGLNVAVVEINHPKPADFEGEWIHGLGTVSAPNFVAVVDPATGDEKRLLSTRAIVLTIGRLNPELSKRMLGISKLGVDFNIETSSISVDAAGRTTAAGIFAAGKTACGPTPNVSSEIIAYCNYLSHEKTS